METAPTRIRPVEHELGTRRTRKSQVIDLGLKGIESADLLYSPLAKCTSLRGSRLDAKGTLEDHLPNPRRDAFCGQPCGSGGILYVALPLGEEADEGDSEPRQTVGSLVNLVLVHSAHGLALEACPS